MVTNSSERTGYNVIALVTTTCMCTIDGYITPDRMWRFNNHLARYMHSSHTFAYSQVCPRQRLTMYAGNKSFNRHAIRLLCNNETWLLRPCLRCWSGCPPGVTSSRWLWLSHCCSSSFPPSSRHVHSGNNGASSRPFKRSLLIPDTSTSSWDMFRSKN